MCMKVADRETIKIYYPSYDINLAQESELKIILIQQMKKTQSYTRIPLT